MCGHSIGIICFPSSSFPILVTETQSNRICIYIKYSHGIRKGRNWPRRIKIIYGLKAITTLRVICIRCNKKYLSMFMCNCIPEHIYIIKCHKFTCSKYNGLLTSLTHNFSCNLFSYIFFLHHNFVSTILHHHHHTSQTNFIPLLYVVRWCCCCCCYFCCINLFFLK